MGSGGLTTGAAGTPVVGSESDGFFTGGGRDARMSRKVLLREPGPVLVVPMVLFLPFTDIARTPAFPPVNEPRWDPTAPDIDLFATGKLTSLRATATDAVASTSTSVRRPAALPRR